MPKTVTISALRSDLTPYGHHDVIVTLVAGSAGGAVGSGVVVESSTVRLDANGAGSIVLETNDVITPPGTFYRLTVTGSAPTITRSIALTTATASTVAWSAPAIQVADPTSPGRDASSSYVTVPAGTMPDLEADHPPATSSLTNYLAALDEALGDGPGGGAVTSVNDQTGAVDLDAGDVGADPAGSAAAAHAAAIQRANHTGTQSPATISGTAVVTTDPRLADARTPTGHAASHAAAGADPIPVADTGFYGTGADGSATITADTTIVSSAAVGYKHYTDLTVNAGVVLTVAGIIFVSGTLTVHGTISANGASVGDSSVGGNGGGGPGGNSSTTGNGGSGSATTGVVGQPSTNPASGLVIYGGGAGGAGGAGPSGAGGAAGVAYAPASLFTEAGMLGWPWAWSNGAALNRNIVMYLASGAGRGGGGGGGDGATSGGGGGGSGGYLVIHARHVSGAGTIRSNGGTGGTRFNGNTGGGGGGGGGFVGLVTGDLSHGFTLQVNGGAAGSGHGTGAAGVAGSAGNTRVIVGTT